ncbi:HdeD family acid-resistance protein [Paraburkholderia sp. RL17-337-BIB-A]|uniref:HdeD family acid-resistance protein n=1 Tax=Paraburkholderia sp. RL17-337-BIB-A TaxID=3031636 RepID=UPI0038BA67D0
MDELLGRAWWMLILRGTVALLFGILALFWPALTLLLLITLFSVYAIAGGIVAIVGAIRYRATHAGWWVPLLLGICSIGAGMIAVLVPALSRSLSGEPGNLAICSRTTGVKRCLKR